MIVPVVQARFTSVDELPESVRGTGGFGSTGYAVDAQETRIHEESA